MDSYTVPLTRLEPETYLVEGPRRPSLRRGQRLYLLAGSIALAIVGAIELLGAALMVILVLPVPGFGWLVGVQVAGTGATLIIGTGLLLAYASASRAANQVAP